MFEFITRKRDMRRLSAALEGYPEYAPPCPGGRLERKEAEANFEFFMAQRTQRLEHLKNFLAGFSVDLQFSPEGLSALDAWLLRYGGHLIPKGGDVIWALEHYDPAWTGEYAGMNIVNDVGIYAGEYIARHNKNARWGLWLGDGKPGARDMMGYLHPCIFGLEHALISDKYPLHIVFKIFDCCEGSRRRHDGKYFPCNRPEDFFRLWGDENELVRRVRLWSNPDAPKPIPYSQLVEGDPESWGRKKV